MTTPTKAGTILQIVGYGLAIPTEGASLTLVVAGETFDAGATATSVTHDLTSGKPASAIATTAVAVVFKGAGTMLEKAEKASGNKLVQKVIKNAPLSVVNKVTDKVTDALKETGTNASSGASTMQQDHTKVQPVLKSIKTN